ncbi:YeeE/YedE family protein [Azospirillum griseum]|uniref:YeeE/YedE family protein n=1 Tax=Azospirillum griseum TaxID=2496639 RepID=A0A431VJ95_9PROT|nr:YeeE/YedE family protein [Azospirillum griseum]RTR21984.1 YeeE/YedE family protein [Azospirillum griseum]
MTGPVTALAGGALIGAAAAGMILINGRITGISGILRGALQPGGMGWRVAFIAGLLLAGLVARWSGVPTPEALSGLSPLWLLAAGLLVGAGTRIGSGCTSGHGVCGLANLSPRSLAATLTFIAVAAATVFVTRHLL